MQTEEKLIPFQKVDIAVPAQEFRMEYAVTELNRMSVVREFILRLLNLAPLSDYELAAYFDFSKKELNIAIQDLLRTSFIKLNQENKIELTQAGENLFKGSMDGKPWVPTIEERSDQVSFDLITMNLVNKAKSISDKTPCIKLDADPEYQRNSIKMAERSFQKKYFEFLEGKKSSQNDFLEANNKKVDIYKVSQTRLLRDFSVKEEQLFSYSAARNAVDRSSVMNVQDPNNIREKITQKLSYSYGRTNIDQILPLAEQLDDDVFLNYVSSNGFDLSSYIEDVHEYHTKHYRDGRESIFGTIFITESWDKIASKLEAIERKHRKSKNYTFRGQWLAPKNHIWGRSSKLLEILNKIHAIDSKIGIKKASEFRLLLSCINSNEEHEWRTVLSDAPKDYIHTYSGELQGGNVELFYIAGEFAIVLYHLILPELCNIPVPVGFITEEPSMVANIETALDGFLEQLGEDYEKHYQGPLYKSMNNKNIK